jgi:hypothetical protein
VKQDMKNMDMSCMHMLDFCELNNGQLDFG